MTAARVRRAARRAAGRWLRNPPVPYPPASSTPRLAPPPAHLALLLVAVAAVVGALLHAADRLNGGLIVPLRLVDPYGPDGADIAGQPAGTGATALETTVHLHVDDADAPA